MSGPLEGIRIIDMTHVILGPYATQQLADLGADVIKIESPIGDPMRYIGPCKTKAMGPIFLHINRNKRSISLDLKKQEARDILYDLLKTADVFACNMRSKALSRLGLDWDTVSSINPKLIYASMVGFSPRGPYADEAAFDDVIQAAVALPHIVSEASGTEPRYVPSAIADRVVGLYAMGAISSALYAREKRGIGQKLDIPMFEVMSQFVLGDHLYGHTFSPSLAGFGYPRLLSKHRKPYTTKDGLICCMVYTDDQWKCFLESFGYQGLFETDERFKDIATRTKNIDSLYGLLADEFSKYTNAEIASRLGDGLPIFSANTLESLTQDPQLSAIDFIVEEEHPTEGTTLRLGIPSEWSATIPDHQFPAPNLGQHSSEILEELSLSTGDIQALIRCGVVFQHSS